MRVARNVQEKSMIMALTVTVALLFFFFTVIGASGVSRPLQSHTVALKADRGIMWDARINFSESGGKNDYVVFGEATDANDGPPADSHDVVKPPAPIPPYIRAWLNDNIPAPYDVLWKDYRHHSDTKKTWNLTIQWIPPGSSPTSVTLSWNKNQVNTSEYEKVLLLNSTGVIVADLIASNSYTVTCPPWVPQTFTINCSADTKPPSISNHSPVTGETGDSYTFNATVIDDMTPANKLVVKVNWVHGSSTGNDSMVYTGGNRFIKTITLNNYTTSDLSYHIYAKDNSKTHNTNYTPELNASITDDEAPRITGNSGNVIVGTGDMIILWVTGSDNIGITSAIVSLDSVNHDMTWSSSNSRWEYIYITPSGDTTDHSYTVSVYDATANSKTNGPYTITIFDNDAPIITADSGSVNVGTGDTITLWVQATDNIAVTSAKNIIDSINHSMTWNSGLIRWEYSFTAPLGNITSHSYTVTVYDAAGNSKTNGPYAITVYDNDPPVITNVLATPSLQFVNGQVNISATITDNINILEKKVRITGPSGYAPVNISMTHADGNSYYYTSIYSSTGTYNYSLWAKDSSNNGVTSSIHQFNIYAEIKITTLLFGWNFISIPFNQNITKTDLYILHGGNECTWSEAVSEGLVLGSIFDWNRSGQVYLLTNSLAPGRGYWLYAFYDCEIWATGLNPLPTTTYITPLLFRWNVIGAPVNQTVNKTNLIITYLGVDYNWTQATTNQNPTGGPLVINDLFGWNRNQPQGYIISTTLNAGYCYWIYAYYGCTLKRQL